MEELEAGENARMTSSPAEVSRTVACRDSGASPLVVAAVAVGVFDFG